MSAGRKLTATPSPPFSLSSPLVTFSFFIFFYDHTWQKGQTIFIAVSFKTLALSPVHIQQSHGCKCASALRRDRGGGVMPGDNPATVPLPPFPLFFKTALFLFLSFRLLSFSVVSLYFFFFKGQSWWKPGSTIQDWQDSLRDPPHKASNRQEVSLPPGRGTRLQVGATPRAQKSKRTLWGLVRFSLLGEAKSLPT